jgi:hypothetical protein
MKAESVRYLAMLHTLATANGAFAKDNGNMESAENFDNIAGMIEEIVMLEGDSTEFHAERAQCQREIESLEGSE